MISIGAIYGGPELEGSHTNRGIRAVMQAAKRLRNESEVMMRPEVNVVFHVPGSITGPDWDEPRAERYSRKRLLLLVSVPVPKEILWSDRITDFLIDSLHAANKLAFQVLHKKGVEFPLADAEALVERIKAEIMK